MHMKKGLKTRAARLAGGVERDLCPRPSIANHVMIEMSCGKLLCCLEYIIGSRFSLPAHHTTHVPMYAVEATSSSAVVCMVSPNDAVPPKSFPKFSG